MDEHEGFTSNGTMISRYLVWCLLSLLAPNLTFSRNIQEIHQKCKISRTAKATPPSIPLCTEQPSQGDAPGVTIQGKVVGQDCTSPHSEATLVIWQQRQVENSNDPKASPTCKTQVVTNKEGRYQAQVPSVHRDKAFHVQVNPAHTTARRPFVTKFVLPETKSETYTFDIALPDGSDESLKHHFRGTRDIHEYEWDDENEEPFDEDKRNWGEGTMQWLRKRAWDQAAMNWLKKRSWGNANTDWLKRNWGTTPWLKRKNWGAAEADWLKKRGWDSTPMTWLKKRTWGNANTDWLKRTWGDAGITWLKKRSPSWAGAEAEWLKKRDWNSDDAAWLKRQWDNDNVMSWLKRSWGDASIQWMKRNDDEDDKRSWTNANTDWIKRDYEGIDDLDLEDLNDFEYNSHHRSKRSTDTEGSRNDVNVHGLEALGEEEKDVDKRAWDDAGISWMKKKDQGNKRAWDDAGISWMKRNDQGEKRAWDDAGIAWMKKKDGEKRAWDDAGIAWMKKKDGEKRAWDDAGIAWMKKKDGEKRAWDDAGIAWMKKKDGEKRAWDDAGIAWMKKNDEAEKRAWDDAGIAWMKKTDGEKRAWDDAGIAWMKKKDQGEKRAWDDAGITWMKKNSNKFPTNPAVKIRNQTSKHHSDEIVDQAVDESKH